MKKYLQDIAAVRQEKRPFITYTCCAVGSKGNWRRLHWLHDILAAVRRSTLKHRRPAIRIGADSDLKAFTVLISSANVLGKKLEEFR
jgi:hypothetical protein